MDEELLRKLRILHSPSPYDGRCISCAWELRSGIPGEFVKHPCTTRKLLDGRELTSIERTQLEEGDSNGNQDH